MAFHLFLHQSGLTDLCARSAENPRATRQFHPLTMHVMEPPKTEGGIGMVKASTSYCKNTTSPFQSFHKPTNFWSDYPAILEIFVDTEGVYCQPGLPTEGAKSADLPPPCWQREISVDYSPALLLPTATPHPPAQARRRGNAITRRVSATFTAAISCCAQKKGVGMCVQIVGVSTPMLCARASSWQLID